MPLRDHLRELRRRLVLAVLGIVVGAVVGWLWYPELFGALQEPVTTLADDDGRVQLNFAGVATGLDVQIKVSLFAGVLLSSPWWIYQLWAFVTPGLTRRERWHTVGFVAAGVPLFLGGAALAWFFLPRAVGVLTEFTPSQTANLLDAQGYLTFVLRMVLAFGVAFLLPVLLVGLGVLGVVSGRGLLTGWRWAVLLAFVFAAVATPSADLVSMFALALPVCGLYFAAVGLCLGLDRRRERRAAVDGVVGGAPA